VERLKFSCKTYFDYQKPGHIAQKTNDTRSLLKDALLISIQLK